MEDFFNGEWIFHNTQMWFSKPKIFSKQQIVIYIAYSHIAIVQHGRSHPSGDIFAVSLSNKIWMAHGPGWFRVMCFFWNNLFAACEEIHFSQRTWPRMFRKKLRGGVAAEVRHRGWSSCRAMACWNMVGPTQPSTLNCEQWRLHLFFFMFRGSGTRTGEGFRMNQGMHWHFQDGNRLLMAGRRHLQQQDFFLCQGKMVNRRCRWMELIWESRKA